MTLTEAQDQRPKLETRMNAAMAHLAHLVRHLDGGSAAIAEVQACIMALDVQRCLEIEIIANGTATNSSPETL